MDLVNRPRSTNSMVSSRDFGFDGLAVNHAGVIDEHDGCVPPVERHHVDCVGSDEAQDCLVGGSSSENRFFSVNGDDSSRSMPGSRKYALALPARERP